MCTVTAVTTKPTWLSGGRCAPDWFSWVDSDSSAAMPTDTTVLAFLTVIVLSTS